MSTAFALDLRAARKKSGFTQGDIAHLLDCNQSLVSDLEQGRITPTLEHVVTLSLIYGRSFESLFSVIVHDARTSLSKRLPTLPDITRKYARNFNRSSSIKKLQKRLKAELSNNDYGNNK